MTEKPSTGDAPVEHTTRATVPVGITATSETSWMITTGHGSMILGHATQHADTYTAYDAQELRIGDYPTRDDAIDAITTGTH